MGLLKRPDPGKETKRREYRGYPVLSGRGGQQDLSGGRGGPLPVPVLPVQEHPAPGKGAGGCAL